jgi:hypothetical protein
MSEGMERGEKPSHRSPSLGEGGKQKVISESGFRIGLETGFLENTDSFLLK